MDFGSNELVEPTAFGGMTPPQILLYANSAISQSRLSLVWYIFQKYHVTYRTLANGVMFDDPPITVGSCAVHW